VAACSLLLGNCLAEDLTTRDGKKYENVREIEPARDGIVFSYGPDGGFARAKVLFKNLSDDLQRKYGYVYDPFEDGLLAARQNRRISLTLNSAFPAVEPGGRQEKGPGGEETARLHHGLGYDVPALQADGLGRERCLSRLLHRL
jgi:hypothetical protein